MPVISILGLCFGTVVDGAAFKHEPTLVALSFAIAFLASFTALDLAGRLRAAQGTLRWLWHLAAAMVLGGGIWSMHFLGMLAFEIPLPVSYHVGLTVFSLLSAILLVGVGLALVDQYGTGLLVLAIAGLLVGAGVVAMHYTGMAAMIMPARPVYAPGLFALSVLIALAAATVALLLAFKLEQLWQRLVSAVVMALAICGMHYTGMAGTTIEFRPELTAPISELSRPLLAMAVAGATLIILALAWISTITDRRYRAMAEREAQALRDFSHALELRVQERTDALRLANEELAEQTKRAQEANQAKSSFLASVSHELRTPLNGILGFAQLLEFNQKREPLTAKQARAVAQIRTSGKHLLQLIDDILDLSRIEAGQLLLSIEPVPVADLFEVVHNTVRPLAEQQGISLTVVTPPKAVHVWADRTRLTQVLINLVSNAIKYNRPQGRASLKAEVAGETLHIMVIDTGLGIPKHRLGELFQPFNRLGQEKSAIEGTGIGLTISRQLVERMRGSITVNSSEGQGSCFTVSLPSAPARAIRHIDLQDQVPCLSGHRGRTILYVEDNPSNLALMRDLIESLNNAALLEAQDGLAGLVLARAHRPDLIVLDINLPGIDGFQILEALRADAALARIPVIALSANALPREIERGLALGFRHYLTKPLDIQAFLAVIDRIFSEASLP